MEVSVSKYGIKLTANIFKIGDDFVVFIKGGDKPHVGASVLSNSNELKSCVFRNHKDDIALKIIAKKIKKYCDKNVCLVGGIHIDNITKKQIELILKLSKKLGKKIGKNILL